MAVGLEENKNLVKAVKETKGNIAEVGVANGDSAEVIAQAKASYRHLYLFDTFTGLPEPGRIDGEFHEGQYATSYGEVVKRFKKYHNVHVIKGVFPNTAIDKIFSFVHLDVDLYQSTKDCMEYFWPRLKKNGIIILHDYKTECAVRVAVLEYMIKVNGSIEEYNLAEVNQVLLRAWGKK